ncbi:zinc ribbon domain-containing protein [Planococcus alpniumensis]|uniref:zinc ribbon domain-containing protein n=1 Tax=Planococcus alpniumensis TaxID=2708345 RepID=UPI001B8D22A3|nr:zinc ribbon domain-containing protein [Planococcus sp. MSAK28401]
MKCPNCQHEQDTGKFCGKCGAGLVANPNVESQATAAPEPAGYNAAAAVNPVPTEPNQHVEKVKVQSKQYWNYFLRYFKKPGLIVDQSADQFVNALITMGIFALFFSLAIYKNLSMAISPMDDFGDFFGSSQSLMPSFFSVLFGTVLTLGFLFALAAACIFVVNKFAGPDESFKSIVTSFGTLMVPSVALVVLAYALLLISSMTFGNLMLFISLSLAISVMPLYLVTALLKKTTKSFDSYYAYLTYIVLFTVGTFIIMTVFFDSTIGRYMDDLNELFYFF